MPRNIIAERTEIVAAARGLIAVLATCLSISRSQRSFIIQPAERIIMAPPKNQLISLAVSIISLGCAKIAHQPGSNNNHQPIGLSSLAIIANG